MAKNTMVDTVADAVVRAEIAVVRAGRHAVKAVQRGVDAGTRKVVAARRRPGKPPSGRRAKPRGSSPG